MGDFQAAAGLGAMGLAAILRLGARRRIGVLRQMALAKEISLAGEDPVKILAIEMRVDEELERAVQEAIDRG